MNRQCWLWIFLNLNLTLTIVFVNSIVSNPRSVPVFNTSSGLLTITGFSYNQNSVYSEWVSRLLGEKSVFHSKHTDFQVQFYEFLSKDPLTEKEIHDRHENVHRVFTLPHFAVNPLCSIETLGFIKLDEEMPFKLKGRLDTIKPLIGQGYLTFSTHIFHCFYRGVYENWRMESSYTKPNYWAVLSMCVLPPSVKSCSMVDEYLNSNPSVQIQLSLIVSNSTLTTTFSAVVFDKEKAMSVLAETFNPMAVCVAVPYTSTDQAKAQANGAMFAEWVRYYLKLGMKVIIYDRDGANEHILFDHNNSYNSAQNIRLSPLDSNLVYHGYTIRGVLDPRRKGLRYDNTEEIGSTEGKENSRKMRFEMQGHDKTMTFTQCRFEAKAVYGIDRVLVTDFDEFLYCPIAGPKAKDQARFFQRFILTQQRLGVDQVMIPQRLVLNRTENQRDCIVEKVKQGHSLFDCFAAYEYYCGGHSVKSLHIGLSCPLTGYHYACLGSETPRAYDCSCQIKYVKPNPFWPFNASRPGRDCGLVHLSTNRQNYRYDRYQYDEDLKVEARSRRSQLWELVHGKD